MARMSAASWRGEHGSRSMSRHDIVCIHTIVGYAPAHAAHFSTDGNGRIYQSRDTRYRSAANLNGNHRIIAIENADHGSMFPSWNTNGSNVPAFTASQREGIAKILAWAHKTHGIPLVMVPDSKPGRRGIAYHRQGVDPYRVSGGELWSSAYGKVCPGDRRIAQIPEIIARAKQIVGGGGPPKEWDELASKKEIGDVFLAKLDSAEGRDALSKAIIIAFRHDSEFKDEVRKAVVDGLTIGHRHREDFQAEFEKAVRQAVRQEQ